MPGSEPDKAEREGAATAAMAPHPRELRAQAMKRLQVGLFGLATMLLLVALANIINERVRRAEAGGTASSAASTSSAADPLADLGVIPSPDASGRKRPGAPTGH